jgi:altronate dehydratase
LGTFKEVSKEVKVLRALTIHQRVLATVTRRLHKELRHSNQVQILLVLWHGQGRMVLEPHRLIKDRLMRGLHLNPLLGGPEINLL